MSNPDTKYLKVISGQEISLSSKGITVQCSGGAVKIEILKSGRINLYAQEEIQIGAKGAVIMDAERMIHLQGEKTIRMQSVKGGAIVLDEDGKLNIQGIEVHEN